jgi:hypothetical protein
VDNGQTSWVVCNGPREEMDGRAGRKRVRRVGREGAEVESENRGTSVKY